MPFTASGLGIESQIEPSTPLMFASRPLVSIGSSVPNLTSFPGRLRRPPGHSRWRPRAENRLMPGMPKYPVAHPPQTPVPADVGALVMEPPANLALPWPAVACRGHTGADAR